MTRILRTLVNSEPDEDPPLVSDLLGPFPPEPDDLEGLDLLTGEDYEALSRFFSHHPESLDQIFAEVAGTSDFQSPPSSASASWDEALANYSLETSAPIPTPEVSTEKHRNESVQVPQSGFAAKTPENNNPGNSNTSKEPTPSDIDTPEVFTLKSVEAYKVRPVKTMKRPIPNPIRSKKLTVENRVLPVVQPKIIFQPLPESDPEEEIDILTFSFSEEYPEFSKEGFLGRRVGGASRRVSTPNSFSNPVPAGKPKEKRPFVFHFPRGRNHRHEWLSKQKQRVDDVERENASRSFFDILLTDKNGVKVVCERNNKLFLERQEKARSSERKCVNDASSLFQTPEPGTRFPGTRVPETPQPSSSKSSARNLGKKKPPVARKSCSKGSAKHLQSLKLDKITGSKSAHKDEKNLRGKRMKSRMSHVGNNPELRLRKESRINAGSDIILLSSPEVSNEDESESSSDESMGCEPPQEPPVVTLSSDDEDIIVLKTSDKPSKHHIITLP